MLFHQRVINNIIILKKMEIETKDLEKKTRKAESLQDC